MFYPRSSLILGNLGRGSRGIGLGLQLFGGIFIAISILTPIPAYAYIGPGAGFAFLGSAFVFLFTIALAIITLLLWPLQLVIRKLRGLGVSKKARFRRVVIVGLDGLEPTLVEQYMRDGRMPNLARLKTEGGYARLGTTLPALSPVAWSSFQTGVNPGAHNIFDFLTRDKRRYLPILSSTESKMVKRLFGLLKRSEVLIARKSKPFWKILGAHGIFSNVLRVPISYPPEPFYGNILSAMCTPDLKGTQGTFTFYTTDKARLAGGHDDSAEQTGGVIRAFQGSGQTLSGTLEGPPNPNGSGYLAVDFRLERADGGVGTAKLFIGEHVVELKVGEFSDWIDVDFLYKRKPLSGIVRFCLRRCDSEIELYISPVNVNPEKPVLPIAKPIFFAGWLARRLGLFGTLGLMEDTWGRNEKALDDQSFLDQAYLTQRERERMFFDVLERTREGLCACVFDASDRIQHMFWRYLDPKHPSPREDRPEMAEVIPEMYGKMDDLVGRVREKLSEKDLLIILSDHGFTSFRRCLALNRWLLENGYLFLKDGATGSSDYLRDVDWTRTRAFGLGLTGLYLNIKGREQQGIVLEEDAPALKQEISQKLEQLIDPQDGSRVVSKVYAATDHYKGLYTEDAPDLIVGYAPGYRVSWDSVTGVVENEIFSDNLKAWSGDHHVDPALIPGILFASVPLKTEDPHITDLAPTVLHVFGIKAPAYMEGQLVL